MTKKALSINEACAVIGIGRTSLYREIGNGNLPALKIGKRTIILQTAIDDFIAKLENYKPKNPATPKGE